MTTKRVTTYIIIIALVLFILLLSMAFPLVTNSADFSIYNSGWNGCSRLAVRTYDTGRFTPNLELSSGEEMEIVHRDIVSYDLQPELSTMVFLGPKRDFDAQETDHIHNFLINGGNVLLADDIGRGNSLLNALEGTDSRFVRDPVLDLSFEKKPHFAVAYDLKDHPITKNVSHILLNKPTAIEPDENATSLVYTSRASWLDKNRNGIWDLGEPKGGFPVLTVEPYGRGSLVLLSDPSVLINSMLDKLDNRIFANNILGYISAEKDNVIFDESHREQNIVYALVYTTNYPSNRVAYGVIMIAMITSIFIVIPEERVNVYERIKHLIIREKEIDDRDPVKKLLNQHPDWNENKLMMINERFAAQRDD